MKPAQKSEKFLPYQMVSTIIVLFVLSFAAKTASASADNINPNLGDQWCQSVLKIPTSEARKYVMTGEPPSNKQLKHTRAWYATALGDVEVLKELIKDNPGLLKDKDLVALAAGLNNSNVLALFLSRGADPNSRDSSGLTLLDEAASCEHAVNMMYLINAGADPYIKTKHAGDAMDCTLGGIRRPVFTLGVMVLLSSGYNPMCRPGAGKGTAYALYKYTLLNEHSLTNNNEEKLKNLVRLMKNIIEIRKGLGREKCVRKLKR